MSPPATIVATFLIAGAATGLILIPLRAALAARDVIDLPYARSSHTVATPRGGRLGVVLGFWVAIASVLAFFGLSTDGYVFELVAAICLAAAALGLADDIAGLPARARLLITLILGIVLAIAVPLEPWGLLVLVPVAFAVATNAVNFMDGINGITGTFTVVSSAWFVKVGITQSDALLTVLAIALAGAAAGFLPHNVPRARMFLGDCGSYFIGAVLACVATLALASGAEPREVIAPFVIYLADTGWTIIRRLRNHESITEAHRSHVYQRLTDRGLTHSQVAAFVGACIAACCLAAGLLPGAVALAACVVIAAGYLSSPSLLASRTNR